MASVNTVLGPIDTADLGMTLIHEHLFVSAAGIQKTFPEHFDRQGIIDDAVAALTEAYDDGVRTIVDMTTMDLGRDVSLAQEVSRRSGVNIIATTGHCLYIPFVFSGIAPDRLGQYFYREVVQGIDGTAAKAGVIKASSAGQVTKDEETVLRAVACAHHRTNARISTHTWPPGRVGMEQLEILCQEGVNPSSVYLGHCNEFAETDYLLAVLEKGAWVGLDRFPGANGLDWRARTQNAKSLIDAGFGGQLMLSNDYIVPRSYATPEDQRQAKERNPDGYCFVVRRVLPYLRELGVADEVIHQILVDNPRRYFEGK